MKKLRRMIVATLVLLGSSASGFAAGEFGTADEAKALLEKTVVAIKADRAATLDAITKGDAAFKDRDLYAFCGDAEGMLIAHGANATLVGTSLMELKDKAGMAFGEAMYKAAAEGTIAEVAYLWPRPNQTEPIPKVAFVTRIGDAMCGVGYYK
jgi:signal transduction histidine kinase